MKQYGYFTAKGDNTIHMCDRILNVNVTSGEAFHRLIVIYVSEGPS